MCSCAGRFVGGVFQHGDDCKASPFGVLGARSGEPRPPVARAPIPEPFHMADGFQGEGHDRHYSLVISTGPADEFGQQLAKALGDTLREILRAARKHPSTCPSSHHRFSILREEVDELWDDVKADDVESAKVEAVQVAAMALRFITDVK